MDQLKKKIAMRAQSLLREKFGRIDRCRTEVTRISDLETMVVVFPTGKSRFFVVKVREML